MYAPLADAGGVLPPELPEVDEFPFPLLDELDEDVDEPDELAKLLVEPMPLGPPEAPELDVLELVLELVVELVLLELLAVEPLEL
jgi:hypothetical protein